MRMLKKFLDEFGGAMLQKFVDRRERAIRRWGSSVTEPDFDWEALSLENVESHLREEMHEWLQDDGPNRIGEDVDLANMAFLDWVARRRLLCACDCINYPHDDPCFSCLDEHGTYGLETNR